MDPAVAVIAVVSVVGVMAIIGRFASAFAKRLEQRPAEPALPDPAIAELRQELEAVHERLDFLERILAQKEQSERALPRKQDQPAPKVRTPT